MQKAHVTCTGSKFSYNWIRSVESFAAATTARCVIWRTFCIMYVQYSTFSPERRQYVYYLTFSNFWFARNMRMYMYVLVDFLGALNKTLLRQVHEYLRPTLFRNIFRILRLRAFFTSQNAGKNLLFYFAISKIC